MLRIGILEDHKIFYTLWKKSLEKSGLDVESLWLVDFESCYKALGDIDVLIADRLIACDGIEEDLILDGHIEKIKQMFSGPIVLCSDAATPHRHHHHFRKVLKSKMPPKSLDFIPLAAR